MVLFTHGKISLGGFLFLPRPFGHRLVVIPLFSANTIMPWHVLFFYLSIFISFFYYCLLSFLLYIILLKVLQPCISFLPTILIFSYCILPYNVQRFVASSFFLFRIVLCNLLLLFVLMFLYHSHSGLIMITHLSVLAKKILRRMPFLPQPSSFIPFGPLLGLDPFGHRVCCFCHP